MSAPIATPWQKPAQAAETSNAAACVPSWWATIVAADGVCSRWETVATTTQSSWPGSTPARSSACREASTDMETTVSSGSAMRRARMPERCCTHSSVESIAPTISLLGTERRGR